MRKIPYTLRMDPLFCLLMLIYCSEEINHKKIYNTLKRNLKKSEKKTKKNYKIIKIITAVVKIKSSHYLFCKL